MTNNITIGNFKPFKCSSCTWRRSFDNYCDSATITLPAIAMLKAIKENTSYSKIQTGSVFTLGMPVTIEAGYDGKNYKRFEGFIAKIILSSPLVIECEGYSYLLQKKNINKQFVNTTLKGMLQYLTEGTAIVLSKHIPDVKLKEVIFRNITAIQALDWIKTNMLMTVYFNFNELYAGLRYTKTTGSVINHRLNWNVVNDKELSFNVEPPATVQYQFGQRAETGEKKRTRIVGKEGVKELRVQGYDVTSEFAKSNLKDKQRFEDNKTLRGKITTFLFPFNNINDVSNISCGMYPEKKGKYIIESIEGSFSASGGRETIGLDIQV